MQYYVALSGEKVGPLTQFKLVEMLREGELSSEQKIWHQGMDGWLPISEVPSLKSALEGLARIAETDTEAEAETKPPAAAKQKTKKPVPFEVRPLTRFWARQFDYTIVFVLVIIFSDIEIPRVESNVSIADIMAKSRELAESEAYIQVLKMVVFAIPIWHIVEGIMISFFGTTPGKALFGIHVLTPNGSRVPILVGIYRSFLVYILGVGLFYFSLPLLTFAAMTFSFFRLISTGICPWDQMLDLRVQHPPLSFARILLAILAFITLMMLQNLNFS